MKRLASTFRSCAIILVCCASLRTLLAPNDEPSRQLLRESVEQYRNQPPQRRTLGLIYWSKDKVILEEIWTREDPEPDDEP